MYQKNSNRMSDASPEDTLQSSSVHNHGLRCVINNASINLNKRRPLAVRQLEFLKSHNTIGETRFSILEVTGSHAPLIYGWPRTHKPGIPIRPILHTRGSSDHKLTHWLVDTFKTSHTLPKTHIWLCEVFDSSDIPESTMHIFNVQSLFTNIQLEETVDFLYSHISSNELLKHLILLCSKNAEFNF